MNSRLFSRSTLWIERCLWRTENYCLSRRRRRQQSIRNVRVTVMNTAPPREHGLGVDEEQRRGQQTSELFTRVNDTNIPNVRRRTRVRSPNMNPLIARRQQPTHTHPHTHVLTHAHTRFVTSFYVVRAETVDSWTGSG